MATIKDFFVKQGAQATTTVIAGAGQANQITLSGGVSGSPGIVTLTASGTDTNINVNVVTKGTGSFTVNGSAIGVPGGTNGQIQYNNSGVFGGISTTGTGNVVLASAPAIVGGSHLSLTGLSVRNAGTGAFDLALAVNTTMTANRTLTIVPGDVDRSITLAGNLSFASSFTTSGANTLTLTTTAATNVTLPSTGTLATLAGTETFTSKTLTAPALSAPTFSTTAAVTAGTNAQGQGALTSDYNIVTTAAANPSGVTLPTATVGRWVTVVNKGANPVTIYPATGAAIDALAANAAFTLPVGGSVMFMAASTTLWYSSAANIDGAGLLNLAGNLTTSGAFASTFTMTAATSVTFPTSGTLMTTTGSTTGSAGSVANALTINNSGTGAASGTTFNGSSAVTISYNSVGAPSTGGTNATGTWGISISGTAAISTAATITDDTTTNATMFPLWVTANTGNLPVKVTSTKLSFNPSTGVLSSTSFTGAGTGLTGTATSLSIGGNATTATTATTAGSVTNAATFNNSGTGAASGTTFNGSSAITVSHNTVGAVALAGSTMTGALTLSGDPTQALHAATKQYVDSLGAGIDVRGSVRAATTAALTVTYANGTAGVGATLTNAGAQAAFALDGVTLAANERVLIKDQASAFQNGIYVVTTVGSGASNWVLTRATDADTPTEVNGGNFTFVEEGTTYADSGWVLTVDGAVTIGTTNLPWAQFSGAGAGTSAGNGIIKVGSTIHFAQSAAYTVGDLPYAGTTSAISMLTSAATGNVLRAGGAGTAPNWGKVELNSSTSPNHITGTLQVGNGGSGAATFTAGYLKASGTAAFTTVSTIPGADVNGNITGNAAGLTATLVVGSGGTGTASAPTQWGMIYAASASAYASTAAGTAGQAMVSNGAAAPTFQTLNLSNLPDAWVKRAVRVATTASLAITARTSTTLTIGGTTLTIDAVSLANNDRVLVKDSTTGTGAGTHDNGIYTVGGIGSSVVLTRGSDADTSAEISAAEVAVDAGTVNAGKRFETTYKAADTLGTTTMPWYEGYNTSHSATANTINTLVLRDGSGNFSAGTITAALTGNATTATTATNANNLAVTDDTTTNSTHYVGITTSTSSNAAFKVSSTKLTFNPSTGVLTASGGFAGTATNATNIAISDDTATNATMYPTWVTTASGNQAAKVSSTKLTFNPSTGALTATSFVGGLSGTATNATNIAITDDTATNATMYPVWVTTTTGNLPAKVASTKMTFNPSSGLLSTTAATVTGTVTAGSTALGHTVQTTNTASVTTTSATNIDSWVTATYRSARYTIQVSDGTNYELSELLIMHDGTTAYITTFGNIFNISTLGSFDASITTGTLTVTYTATAATTKTVKFLRTLMTV